MTKHSSEWIRQPLALYSAYAIAQALRTLKSWKPFLFSHLPIAKELP